MKPLFTIHEGEFLTGDHIAHQLGRKYDVWVPTKDMGVDLLVTRAKRGRGFAKLQVKFSRGFGIREEFARHVVATSWFTLNPTKIRSSPADLWVFVILTLRHERHFVILPTHELRRRIPRSCGDMWNLYLWVFDGGACYDTRSLGRDARLESVHQGVSDERRDYSDWLENWELLDKYAKRSR